LPGQGRFRSIIVGRVDVEANVGGSVDKVEFYVDNELKETDTQSPFGWTWNEKMTLPPIHRLKVVGYEGDVEVGSDEIQVLYLNPFGFNFIEFIKRDGEYNESDEATSGILFGDEINQRVNATPTLSIDNNAIYNSVVITGTADGDYVEGDVYLKKGLYKITFTYEKLSDRGQADLFIGGVKILDQFDTYNATVLRNQQTTKFAFLEGGKSAVRLANNGKNGSSSGFKIIFGSIRFELVDGKGNGDVVNIWGADSDEEIVRGTERTISAITGSRFNFTRSRYTS